MEFKVKTAAQQVAEHYAENYRRIGSAATRDLAEEWGTSRTTVLRGFRLADSVLNARGLAKTEPTRASEFKQEVTDRLQDYQVSWMEFIEMVTRKVDRGAAGEAALGGNPRDELILRDIADVLHGALGKLEGMAA